MAGGIAVGSLLLTCAVSEENYVDLQVTGKSETLSLELLFSLFWVSVNKDSMKRTNSLCRDEELILS